ncbi:MAG TPA: hypothetical protein VLR69_08040 [Thermoanaerobaculia bacterium]|nr:hypothetical protein [Thermoanaerobaculia bacterium]
MPCSRVSRPALLALLALVAAASLLLAAAGYTIVLKDGSTLVAKEKYTVQNGRAIITLLNGTQTFVRADQIDVKKTEQVNKLGLGTGVLVPGSPQDVGTVPAQPRKDETLADLIHKQGAGPREVPGSKRQKDQPAAGRLVKTKAGFTDLSAFPRKPYAHADVTAQLQQFFHTQGFDEVEIWEGTQSDRPLIEISTNSEGSVFKALSTAANGLLQIRTTFPNRLSAFEVLLTTPARERAGQFELTPEMATELVSKRVDVTAFFVHNVQF